ncbi:hypothetical protein PoB_004421300 [Plakobranchus ocellatus]|uniref:Uncharacterized protein n=1 Tax=Plakobranchus ocellatus TaxID=259542 RepID=A0AAV4BDR2_9GAST|nr:hypothetical protein PoB_004421300 [Plakobranchus ocellatus]
MSDVKEVPPVTSHFCKKQSVLVGQEGSISWQDFMSAPFRVCFKLQYWQHHDDNKAGAFLLDVREALFIDSFKFSSQYLKSVCPGKRARDRTVSDVWTVMRSFGINWNGKTQGQNFQPG